MPKRNKSNKSHNTRSKMEAKGSEQGALSAGTNSASTDQTSSPSLSPQRAAGLPREKQQSATNESVSQPHFSQGLQELSYSQSNDSALLMHTNIMNIENREGEHNSQAYESRSPEEGGDNRGDGGSFNQGRQMNASTTLVPNKDGKGGEFYSGGNIADGRAGQAFNPPPPPPQNKDPWQDAFVELRALRSRMDKVDRMDKKMDKIEESTSYLSKQVTTMVTQTSQLESKTEKNANEIKGLKKDFSSTNEKNANEIKDLKKEVSSLRRIVEKQHETISGLSKLKEDCAKQKESISDLVKTRDDFAKNSKKTIGELREEYSKKTKRTIGEMNELLGQQKEQVEGFKANTKRLKTDILHEVDGKVKSLSQSQDHTALKDKAYDKRHNLIISGLPEDADKSTMSAVKDFLNASLGLKDVLIHEAHRIGSPSNQGSNYCRPILLKFKHIHHRNKVWKKRKEAMTAEGSSTIRIQADLPKKLREGVSLMYRVLKAAVKIQKYQSAEVRDYALHLNGREYVPTQLESLPYPLRPSTLAFRSSEEATVFFSKNSFLSNHHPSDFKIKEVWFHSVEQYLAFKRAQLSGQQTLVQRALRADNPADAKSILNTLKDDHTEEYAEVRAQWAVDAIRAKFIQNPKLADALYKTKDLQLGEASRDAVWGIGMDLDNPDALDPTKWSTNGNLLGRSLMDIRRELATEREQRPK